jgi:hypothetical protein
MEWSSYRRLAAAALLMFPILGCPDKDPVEVQEGDVVVQFDVIARATGVPGSHGNNVTITAYKADAAAADGKLALSDPVFSWKSSNPAVVTIANDQNATTRSPTLNFVALGTATLTATLNDPRLTLGPGVSGTITIPAAVVEPAASITVTPKNVAVLVGSTQKISIRGITASGAPALGAQGEKLEITCGDETKCAKETLGNSGAAMVGLPDEVYNVDTTVTLKANKVGTVVMTVKVISDMTGATLASDAITINVVEPTKAVRMEIVPAQPTVFVGQSKQLEVDAYDADGNRTTSSAIWSTSNPDIAQINLFGHITGMSTGPGSPVQANVQITVKASETVQATANLTVYKQVSNVLVQPGAKQLTVGGTQQFTATRRDNNNATIPAASTPITWSTGDTVIARVDQNGLVTAKAPGLTTVRATTAEGITGSIDLTVVAAPVTVKTVVVEPTPFTMEAGFTHHFTYTLKDASGATLPSNFTTVTWSTENGSVATVDQSGNVTAKAIGTTRVVVTTAEGVAGYSDVTVVASTAPTIVRVVVSPAAITLKLSDAKCQFTAKAFDASGNEVLVSGFRWLIDVSYVAIVDGSGLVTFKHAGTTAVRAFYGNDANAPGGSASLTVTSN